LRHSHLGIKHNAERSVSHEAFSQAAALMFIAFVWIFLLVTQ